MHERSAMASGSQVPGRRHLTPYFTGVPALDVEQDHEDHGRHAITTCRGFDATSDRAGIVGGTGRLHPEQDRKREGSAETLHGDGPVPDDEGRGTTS